jgi:hypothetical protein
LTNVLVIAPRYDDVTVVTSVWCERLVVDLQASGHAVDVRIRDDAAIELATEVLQSSQLVIFFGHGDFDRLLGQPRQAGEIPRLLDLPSIAGFEGRPIYAVACNALATLGREYGDRFPDSFFIGYTKEFLFTQGSELEFGQIANRAANALVEGGPPQSVVKNLITDWETLSDDFIFGELRHRPDAFIGAAIAAANAERVGIAP